MSTDVPVTPLAGRGLFAVPGLRGAAVATGVKPSGALDLGLVVADEPRAAAAMFTTNATAAAPVTQGRALLASHSHVKTICVNSGNANALTGPRGDHDCEQMQRLAAARCGGPALVLSTGVIGVPLPLDPVLRGIHEASEALSYTPEDRVARAFLTTDTGTKRAACEVPAPALPQQAKPTFTVGGVAKGSGMIHPNMATMLAVMATDAEVEPGFLRELLPRVVDRSFHRISVDGDTSTNDAVVVLAGGSGRPPIQGPGPEADALEAGLLYVARQLAAAIVEDGEGATRLLELTVSGGRDEAEAARVAEAIVTSSLVKTALAGGDPNWGRILAAAGNAGVALEVKKLRLDLGDLIVFEAGAPVAHDVSRAEEVFQHHRVPVHLDLGLGPARVSMVTTDLTKRYVEINAEYTT